MKSDFFGLNRIFIPSFFSLLAKQIFSYKRFVIKYTSRITKAMRMCVRIKEMLHQNTKFGLSGKYAFRFTRYRIRAMCTRVLTRVNTRSVCAKFPFSSDVMLFCFLNAQFVLRIYGAMWIVHDKALCLSSHSQE